MGFVLIFTNACKKDEDKNPATLLVGQSYQGGIIAYILQSEDPNYDENVQHGIIAAPTDQSVGIQWYNGSNTVTAATAIGLGTGNDNTATIIASQGAGNYAAKICSDLVLGGHDDWYLPSKDELNKLYKNKTAVGGFADDYYWSSTEADANGSWVQDFTDGIQAYGNKGFPHYVRAIRSF